MSTIFDCIGEIVRSERSDADVGLMLRRVLNEPTLARLSHPFTHAADPTVKQSLTVPAADPVRDEGFNVGDYVILLNFTPTLVAELTYQSDSPGIWHARSEVGTHIVHVSRMKHVPDDISPAPAQQPATVQPTITGERAGLWIFDSVLVHEFDDVTDAAIAAMNINAAYKEWLTVRPR